MIRHLKGILILSPHIFIGIAFGTLIGAPHTGLLRTAVTFCLSSLVTLAVLAMAVWVLHRGGKRCRDCVPRNN